MLKLTKTGIGLLTKQYRSVLRKCLLLNLGLFLVALSVPDYAHSTLRLRTSYSDATGVYTGAQAAPEGGTFYSNSNITYTEYTIVTLSDLTWSNISGRPTKLSQFTNDSGYITGITKAMVTSALGYTPVQTDTNTTYSAASSGGLSLSGTAFSIANSGVTTARIANSAVTDAKIASGITASKITQTASYRFVSDTEKAIWNSKANAATTLSGYGIGDAYTKTEVNSLLSELSAPDMSNYYTKSETYSRDEIANLDSLNYYYTRTEADARYSRLSADNIFTGLQYFKNASGTTVSQISFDGDGGNFYLFNTNGKRTVKLTNSSNTYEGRIYLYSGNENQRISLNGNNSGGSIELFNSNTIVKTILSDSSFQLNGSTISATGIVANAIQNSTALITSGGVYDALNYYYTFRVDETTEVTDSASFFQKDFSTLQEVDLQSKNPTHLGAFAKCDEVCPRPSERFVSPLSQEQMLKNDASVDAGTFSICSLQIENVNEKLSNVFEA